MALPSLDLLYKGVTPLSKSRTSRSAANCKLQANHLPPWVFTLLSYYTVYFNNVSKEARRCARVSPPGKSGGYSKQTTCMTNLPPLAYRSAGVTGLTSAVLLAEDGYHVTILAAHVPGDSSIEYTSPW